VGASLPRAVGAASSRAALARSYDRNAALVFGLLLRIVGERGVAERLLVGVFAALGQADAERSDWDTTVWLVQRARALALAAGSGRTATPALPRPAAHVVPFCRDAQRVAQVRERLGRLTLLDREMLELAYFGGLGSRTIAARSGLDPTEVHARLRTLCAASRQSPVCAPRRSRREP
jgi:RNA polymerase sigma-70 factor (ECF subfamily)